MAGRKKKDIEAGRESEKSIVEGEKTHEEEHVADITEYLNLSALTEDTEEQQEKIKCFDLLTIDTISIELGRELLPLLDPKEGAELKKQCSSILHHIELELGIVMPGVRFRDNYHLKSGAYVIKIREIEAAEGSVMPGCFFAIGPKERLMRLPGEITDRINDDLPGKWIAESLRSRAERLGCTLIDPVNVIAGHLGDICRSHAAEFLGFQEVHTLLEKCRKKHPEAVDKVYPALLPLRKIRKILQSLVRESVSIRDLATMLEALTMRAGDTQNVEKLTEYARAALSREICREYMNSRGEIHAIVLEPEMEKTLTSLLMEEDRETFIDEDTDEARSIVSALGEKAALCVEKGLIPVIVCEPPVRQALWKFLVKSHPGLVILSRSEIAPDTKVIDWLKNDKNEVTAGAPTSGIKLEKWPASFTEVIEWLKKEKEKETLIALVFDIRLEKWLASFISYYGEKYDIELDDYACEILINAIEKEIGELESSAGSIPIFLSSIMYYIINSSEGGSKLNEKLQERFPTLRLSYRNERSLFKTLYRNVRKIRFNEEMQGYSQKQTVQLDERMTGIEDKKAVVALTMDIKLEKWLASFVFYNGVRYDIKLDENAEETFVKAIGKGIDMIESPEDSIPIFISSVLYYIFNSSQGGSKLNKKIQERFPRIFISYRDGHSLFKTYRSSMGKISLDAEPPGKHPGDLTASS